MGYQRIRNPSLGKIWIGFIKLILGNNLYRSALIRTEKINGSNAADSIHDTSDYCNIKVLVIVSKLLNLFPL